MHYESRVGHLGGNLSALDALMTLHHHVMEHADTFILSKGHAAGALYITLWSLGLLRDEELETFHADGTLLAGHPVPGWSERIAFATGSLGHGFPVALGMALARHLNGEPGHVYCLTSDGEWQEGATWEALIFWAHRRLEQPLGAGRPQRSARFRQHARGRLDGRDRRSGARRSGSRPTTSTDTMSGRSPRRQPRTPAR